MHTIRLVICLTVLLFLVNQIRNVYNAPMDIMYVVWAWIWGKIKQWVWEQVKKRVTTWIWEKVEERVTTWIWICKQMRH